MDGELHPGEELGLDQDLEVRHKSAMKTARISQLRDHLSRYLDHVRAGAEESTAWARKLLLS
jgi:hypothetical protein